MPTPPALPTWESIEEIVAMLGPASDFRGVKHKEMMEGLIARLKALESPVLPDYDPAATFTNNCTIEVVSSIYSYRGDIVFFALKLSVSIITTGEAAEFVMTLPVETFFTNRNQIIAAVAGEVYEVNLFKSNVQIDAGGSSMTVTIFSESESMPLSIVGMYKILPEVIEE
jgi:hypothetical protein